MVSCPPRYGTPRRKRVATHSTEVVEAMAVLGFEEPHEWQAHALDVVMEQDPADASLPQYRTVGLCVMRQAGKTALIAGRILAELRKRGRHVAYTAQDRNLAREKFDEHCNLILDSPMADDVVIHRRANGSEMLRLSTGSTYTIVTPNKRGPRGRSLDLVVIDEAMAQSDFDVVGSIVPTMAAKADAQLFLCGNAGDETAVMFANYRDIGRGVLHDPDSRMAWLEWAPAEESCDSYDPAVWAEAIPTLDRPNGITSLAVKDAARTMDELSFRREFLNLWVESFAPSVIDLVAWERCRAAETVPDPVFLGFDLTPERDKACLVAAGARDGIVVVEVIEQSEDIRAVIERTVDVARNLDATVLVHRMGPGGAIEYRLERDRVPCRALALTEVAAACGLFYDAVIDGTLRHNDDFRLNDSVGDAIKRPIGDRWRWGRRPNGDISVLQAATVAVYGALTVEAPIPAIF